MQRGHIFALALGSIAIVTGMTAGDAAIGASKKSNSIYYKTQAAADAALAAFDKANPSCQLWTNWQKLCSRTDGIGNVECRKDASRPVRPSRPFCLSNRYGNPIHETEVNSKADIPLMHRFCKKFSTEEGVRVCSEMSPRRPFSGRNLETLRTPLCQIWSKGAREICSEDGSVEGVAKCTELSPLQKRDGPFYCSAVNKVTEEKVGCMGIADATDVFDKRVSFYAVGEIFVGPARGPRKESIVSALYCRKFRKVN